jgi:HSP20 family protein
MRRSASLDDVVMPNVDISEDKENFYIISELPGMADDDVKVTVGEDLLTISGRKERKEEKKQRNYHRTERSFGEFVRSFSLPTNVKGSAIVGTFRNGLLELTLPKIVKDASVPREIQLNATNGKPSIQQNGQVKSVEKAVLA